MIKPLIRGSNKLMVNDFGWGRILFELDYLEKSYVKIGFPEKGKLKTGNKIGSKHEPARIMSEIIMIAAFNEFGTGIIPERPFMRQSFDNNFRELNVLKEKLYTTVVTGKGTAKEALNLLGIWMVSKTKGEIRNGNFASLSEYTKAKKKSDKPLIDTAQMINSIQYDIVFIR